MLIDAREAKLGAPGAQGLQAARGVRLELLKAGESAPRWAVKR